MTPTEITLPAAGLTMAARAWGPEDGAPVLALHGWLDNAGTFDGLAPLLPGLRLVAIDLPGHGRSDHRSADAPQHFIDYLPFVADALDGLGWERAHLMGHSMGGGVCAMFAGALPDRVDRLVLLEGLGPLATRPEDAPATAGKAITQRRALHHKRPRVYETRDEAAARLRAVNPGLTDAALAALTARSLVEHADGGWAYAHDLRLRGTSLMRMTEDLVLAFLGAIDAPTLVVKATNGLPFPEELARTRFEAVREARLVEVEGDHHVHLNHPERVAEAVGNHLRP